MIQFPQDLLNSHWDILSPEIREILLSDTFDSSIETLIKTFNLESFSDQIIDLCTYAIYGLLDQNAFFKELTNLVGQEKSPEIAKRLIIEIIIPTVTIKHQTEIKIESPIKPSGDISQEKKIMEPGIEIPSIEVKEPESISVPEVPTEQVPVPEPMSQNLISPTLITSELDTELAINPLQKSLESPSQPEQVKESAQSAPSPVSPAPIAPLITPTFEEAKTPEIQTPSPFILHTETENVTSVSETRRVTTSPVRPVFYEEHGNTDDFSPKAAYAKLQFSAPVTNNKIGDKVKEAQNISLKDLPVK